MCFLLQDSGFSPVAIVFIAATSALIALAILTVIGLFARKMLVQRLSNPLTLLVTVTDDSVLSYFLRDIFDSLLKAA